MAIPYQPTFSLNPKTGFRYSTQPFVPPQQPINAPPPLGLDGSSAAPPPTMGGQQGPAYANDPFGDGGDNQFQADYKPAAQSLGYTQGTQNPLGMLQAVPILGTAMGAMGAFDNMPNQTYGNYGTYDAQGNVFGPEGRAYNPETGRPAQSYASPSDWYGGWLGIGTPEGAFGSSSSYGKLRAAGENPVNSFLGSYDNSVYRQMDYDQERRGVLDAMGTPDTRPNMTIAGARAARYSNPAAPMGTIADQMAIQSQIARGDYTGLSDDDIDRMEDPNAPKFGYGTGDYAATSFGLGKRNESGTISTTDSNGNPTGTVVSLSSSTNPGQSLSLLDTSARNQLAVNQELDNRATQGYGGMAGFNASDGDGGSYQTDSSGTAGAGTAKAGETTQGVYGMEDEYDDPTPTSNDNDSGGK